MRCGLSLANLLHRIASMWGRGGWPGRQENKASARSKLSAREWFVFQIYMGRFFIYHTFVKTVVGDLTELAHACNAQRGPQVAASVLDRMLSPSGNPSQGRNLVLLEKIDYIKFLLPKTKI